MESRSTRLPSRLSGISRRTDERESRRRHNFVFFLRALRAAGVVVTENPAAMGKTIAEELRHARVDHHDPGFGL